MDTVKTRGTMGLTFRAKCLKKDLSRRDEQMSFRLISNSNRTGSLKAGDPATVFLTKQLDACYSILSVVLV